ncbi:Nucleotide-binding universal stress protein, UspA family [Tistlia consotensis]|uniref:Nucleotide-binding universal stress protein, UspA family n=1 Tax=Tistlia consotensis USBA 355 TaxID=560819 RepID=A0A1Y6B710_9PROT|nr:universal stress protein [Tistlia consotensis]SME88564.1 Nucleotide-binding universal stress protein, UspA family [Tistlia consotensis USBA 355]SNR25063.1 Nucleotide-binding universal stress protein, UspA family [Tistlia consotensis]
MAYKTILVHLDDSKSCKKRVQAALDLAARQDAHVVGLYIAAEFAAPAYLMAQMPQDLLDRQEALRKEATDKALAAFDEAARKAGVHAEPRSARAYADEVEDVLSLHGRYADLVVLGQHDPDDDLSMGESAVEQAVLALGRPLLLVPYVGAAAGFGQRPLLLWDASREAASAVDDALPLLQAAKKVDILSVNPRHGIRGHGEEPGADIATVLARHGVKTEARHVISKEISIADTILSSASDLGSDLLVMGAYGHSRLRELVMGGVTRSVLQHLAMPALMSH